MKVRILRPLNRNQRLLRTGDTSDILEADAKKLIASGVCEPLASTPKAKTKTSAKPIPGTVEALQAAKAAKK